MRSAGTGRRPGLVLPAILMLLGFLVSAAVAEERVRERRLPGQVRSLVGLIQTRRTTISELATEAEVLSAQLERARSEAARGSARLRTTLRRIERLRLGAGAAALRGRGLVVSLEDSPDAPQTRGEVTDLRIQDVDLRQVVNALWRGGAEAVAVNDLRVVATTAIREAGGTILVNFAPVSSPYRVAAIGDSDAMRLTLDRSDIGRQFDIWRQVYGLGFAIRTVSDVQVPGLGADVDLTWANPQRAP